MYILKFGVYIRRMFKFYKYVNLVIFYNKDLYFLKFLDNGGNENLEF